MGRNPLGTVLRCRAPSSQRRQPANVHRSISGQGESRYFSSRMDGVQLRGKQTASPSRPLSVGASSDLVPWLLKCRRLRPETAFRQSQVGQRQAPAAAQQNQQIGSLVAPAEKGQDRQKRIGAWDARAKAGRSAQAAGRDKRPKTGWQRNRLTAADIRSRPRIAAAAHSAPA